MKLLTLFLILLFLPGIHRAQKATSAGRKIEVLYNEALVLSQQGYSAKSVQKLNEILRLDSGYYMASFALADLSHEAGKPEEEIRNLRLGLRYAGDSYPPGYKFLAEALFRRGDYQEAGRSMDQYASLRKSLTPAEQLLRASCHFSTEALLRPVPFQPVDPGDSINTVAEEYWPSLNADAGKLVFTRLVTKGPDGKAIAMPQEDFYFSRHDSTGWNKALPLGPPVNTEENEGAQTLSADGRLLIFTGCSRMDGKGSCDLYISVNRNGTWTVPVNMGEPVNTGAWESQPSLTADGETLYFVSSRRGGKGNMDIWKAVKIALTPEGLPLFGNVTNVGGLNTPGNDLSPFIHADGKTLFFASDGLPGLGGKDLFRTQMKEGTWQSPVNLGFPINTKEDEDGLTIEISGKRAWFASSRNPAKGRDIFNFAVPDSLQPDPVAYLKGVVVDAVSGARLSAGISIAELKTGKLVGEVDPAENEGEFLVCLPSGFNYGISIHKKGYLFASEYFSMEKGTTLKNPQNVQIRLQPVKPGAVTTLKNIFFETNSWGLLEESASQLNEMYLFMKQNPNAVMEVVGHTDNVGTAAYNLDLSGKRAGSVVKELIKRGIEPWRITGKGVGFQFPAGDNSTEEGRRANRRTEFVVKELK